MGIATQDTQPRLLELTVLIPECQGAVRFPAGVFQWTEDEFFQFCQVNRNLRIERTAKGEIIVMSPAGGYSGFRSGNVFGQLDAWARQDGTGIAFDSSTGFRLPNGAMRAPDAAWVRLDRLKALSLKEKEQFMPLCPDFVIEVASTSDALSDLREKMEEYRGSGLPLGWLILPASTQVEVYTAEGVDLLASPPSLTGDPVLPGFKLDLASVWKPPY